MIAAGRGQAGRASHLLPNLSSRGKVSVAVVEVMANRYRGTLQQQLSQSLLFILNMASASHFAHQISAAEPDGIRARELTIMRLSLTVRSTHGCGEPSVPIRRQVQADPWLRRAFLDHFRAAQGRGLHVAPQLGTLTPRQHRRQSHPAPPMPCRKKLREACSARWDNTLSKN